MVYLEAFQIRRFSPNDLTHVMEINMKTLPENYTPNFFLDIFRNCPEAFYIAENSSGLIGYVMCRLEFGFSEVDRLRMVKKGHLVSIAVVNEFRRRGAGYRLLAYALNGLSSRGARECYLEVRTTNLSGIELYKKLGFEIRNRVPAYYQDGADAFVMARLI